MNNIENFPVKCQACKQTIDDSKIFYKHPKIGFVCEDCPEFNDGRIQVISKKGKLNG